MFRIGTVPGSRDELRKFLQGRLRTYFAFLAIFWPAVGLIAVGLTTLIEHGTPTSGSNGVRAMLHTLGALIMAGIFFGFGRRQYSERVLWLVDVVVSLLQGLLFATILLAAAPVIRYRPDTALQVAIAYCVIGRAAVIPCSPRRTLLVSLFLCIPILIAPFWFHSLADQQGQSLRHHYQNEPSRPIHFVLWSVFCSCVSVALATFVSHVIYGLQRPVQRARRL